MLHVEKRRRRDLNQVYVRRGCQLLKRMRPLKKQLAVDCRLSQAFIHLVEVLESGSEVIGKEICQGDDSSGSVLCKRRGNAGAAVAASQQTMSHR